MSSLGMVDRFAARWSLTNERYLQENIRATDVSANLGSGAKVLRYVLQSGMLGLGAYLVVVDRASGGVMIASSIMMGRALAPVEVALGTWNQLVAARQGLVRLREICKASAPPSAPPVVPLLTERLSRGAATAAMDLSAQRQVLADATQPKAEQGREVAARDHPVIHLQHIKRARQHQNVDHATEDGDADHAARAFMQPERDGVIRRRSGQQADDPAGCKRLGVTLRDTHDNAPLRSASKILKR